MSIIILIVGAGLYFFISNPIATEYQRNVLTGTFGDRPVSLVFSELEDTNVTLFFDPGTTLCSIDITLYEPMQATSAFSFSVLQDQDTIHFKGLTRIQALNITLGNRDEFDIGFNSDCTNLKTSITIANSARINSVLYYHASGELNFGISESAYSVDGTYLIGNSYGHPDLCYIDVDLKNDTVGLIQMYQDYTIMSNTGWLATTTPGEYRTSSSAADVDITVTATQTYVWLID
ncbi:MAG: hypothetical protein ACW98Y_22090 [Candidatus Thorarchaeota archaeon]